MTDQEKIDVMRDALVAIRDEADGSRDAKQGEPVMIGRRLERCFNAAKRALEATD